MNPTDQEILNKWMAEQKQGVIIGTKQTDKGLELLLNDTSVDISPLMTHEGLEHFSAEVTYARIDGQIDKVIDALVKYGGSKGDFSAVYEDWEGQKKTTCNYFETKEIMEALNQNKILQVTISGKYKIQFNLAKNEAGHLEMGLYPVETFKAMFYNERQQEAPNMPRKYNASVDLVMSSRIKKDMLEALSHTARVEFTDPFGYKTPVIFHYVLDKR